VGTVTVEEALAIVRHETAALPAERVPLAEAAGRVLADDVRADRDLPPFDRSAMDGFALRAADLARGEPLAVVGEVRAGQWPQRAVRAGETVRIMTGAPVPQGADAVLPIEKATLAAGGVRGTVPLAAGANVVPRGSEARTGEPLVARGTRLDAATLAVLATVGSASPFVARRPRVAVLVTGDEVVDVGETPTAAQIRNGNGPAVAAVAAAAGAEVRLLGIAPDREDALAPLVRAGLEADVLVVSGGVSAGDYDLVEPALLASGARFLFTRVAVKPGAPLVFGRRGATLIFGLPGNPVSAQVTFELFVRPCLLWLQGARAAERPRVEVELVEPLRNRSGRELYVGARVAWREGRLAARPLRSGGSGDLAAHARANALVVVAADREHVPAGARAPALPLDRFLEDDGAPL
jgi:molybdopterin molybdotransferase